MHRNTLILAVAQTISMAAVSMLLLLGGILGAELAPSHALATLSISLTVVATAALTVPAALLMQRFGRRRGFAGAAAAAALAMVLAAVAMVARSFWLFCLASSLIGFHSAFAQQYRFAATEGVAPASAGRAVSIVLLGGIVAGYLGPALALVARDWIGAAPYAGSFAVLASLHAASAALMYFGLEDVAVGARTIDAPPRPLAEIVLQPAFLVAATAGATAYATMSFVMTATPLELHDVRGVSLEDTAWVIQSHIIAMYAPSLVTGTLLRRLGVLPVLLTGTAGLAACALLALASPHLLHTWFALVLLGVGWNFQFVAATVLLAGTSRPSERFRSQAINDLVVFGAQAAAALSAGATLFAFGWRALNLATLPLLAATAALALIARRRAAA